MSATAEHAELLKKQMNLVGELKSVLATQKRALEQLGALDEDYENAPTTHCTTCDSDNEGETLALEEEAKKASCRSRVHPVTDEERKVPHVEWTEPDEEEERGFQATKPWLGAMAPPSNWSWDESSKRDEAPNMKLELEHVHGYRARGCRNNVFWVDEKRIVFPVAAVCVIMNKSTREQKFFRNHDDDILCIDFNAVKRICASGDQGKKPSLFVWSVDDPSKVVAKFNTHKRAVVACNISPDGSRVISVGLDNDHSISVHDINTQSLLIHTKGDTNRILGAHWNLTTAANPNTQFVTVGSKHIKFWTISAGGVDDEKGLLGRKGEYQAFLNVAFTPEYTLVACENGCLYAFEGRKLKRVMEAHNGATFALTCDPSNNRIATGGRDGFVNIWDAKSFKNVKTFDFNNEDACSGLNSIKSLLLDPKHPDDVLVGTITSTIFEINLSAWKASVITTGHFGDLSKSSSYGELWGLATHPSNKTFYTCGEDGTLRQWDIAEKSCIVRAEIGKNALCVSVNAQGTLLAVGFEDGRFGLYQASSLVEIAKFRKTKKRIQSIRFSPDGQYVGVGTASNRVYLFKIDDEDCTYHACCSGNSSVILHIDFSADSKYLQTCSMAYELLFYETATGNQFTKSRDLKDTEWATFSSILGWSVQGIWPKESDGSDVNMVNKSHSGKLLASAEDSGLVKVFNYPCVGSGLDKRGKLRRRPECVQSLGHSEHVTNLEFTAGDSHIVSTGGADNAIMQWKVTA